MKPAYRPYRFPPLSQVSQLRTPAARPAGTVASWQSPLPESFQQGMAEGYREGHEAGLANGRQEGLAQGHAEGVWQGNEAGRQAVLAAFEVLARPLDAMLKGLARLQTDYQKVQRKEMIDLVAKVARQVIRADLALQPTQMLALVDETLAGMPPTRQDIEVFLNPDQLKQIRDLDPKRAKRWSLLGDARLEPGECRVKAGDLEVDAGCEQRLAACMTQISTRLLEGADAEGALA